MIYLVLCIYNISKSQSIALITGTYTVRLDECYIKLHVIKMHEIRNMISLFW